MEPTTRNDTQTTACRRQSSMRKTLSLALASSFMRGRCAKPSSTARAVPATHALDRTGKQSWHAAAEPYTPHGNGLDETSTAAMEAVLRHGKNN